MASAAVAAAVFTTYFLLTRKRRRTRNGGETMTQLRDHTFLGMTQSLCPVCLALVPAKIITKGSRVYFRKRCPDPRRPGGFHLLRCFSI